MTILGLLCLAAIICVIILGFAFFSVNLSRSKTIRYGYIAVLTVFAVVSVFTVKKYMYPKNPDIFRNTDYHVLEHKGFRTDSVFYFARACDDLQNYFPEMSLWDSKPGMVKVVKNTEGSDSLYIADYHEPLYVEKKTHTNDQHKGNEYQLVNNRLGLDIENDGLHIVVNNNTLVLNLSQNGSEQIYEFEFSTPDGLTIRDTSTFKKHINQGYPFLDIIDKAPKINSLLDWYDYFGDAYLLRKSIKISNNSGNLSSDNAKAPLTLFLGTEAFFCRGGMSVNGRTIGNEDGNDNLSENYAIGLPLSDNSFLFSGMGRNKTDVFCFHDKEEHIELRYVTPKMQYLKKDGGKLFISSSIQNILDDSKDGGYFYNLFANEDNFNHINAQIRLESGSAREQLKFEITDYHSENPTEIVSNTADNEFELCVRSYGFDHTKWILNIKNLRETNALQYNNIFWFIWIFLLFVGLRIHFDEIFNGKNYLNIDNPKNLSYTELAAYVVVLSTCTIRLILGWRASTFVPTENITATIMAKMRESIWASTLVITCLLPVSMTLISHRRQLSELLNLTKDKFGNVLYPIINILEILSNKIKYTLGNWSIAAKRKFDKWSLAVFKRLPKMVKKIIINIRHWNKVQTWIPDYNWRLVIYYICLLLCFALLSRFIGQLERICNIYLPVVLYIFFDWTIAKLQDEEDDEPSWTLRASRLVLAAFAFIYLLLKDAGFTIIFAVFFILLHGVEGLLNHSNRNIFKRHKWLKYLIVIAVLSILFCILRFEGVLMLCLFKHISIIFIVMTFILTICFTVWTIIAFKKNGITSKTFFMSLVNLGLITCTLFGILTPEEISDFANSKAHMRFRAEVQKLKEGEKIDDLIQYSDYNSTDITYIMRSAHNQWFINQYIQAEEKVDAGIFGVEKYFVIQPHSNQGSTYTTQTTDLVVTRYLLSEHGTEVLYLFIVLYLLLICIFTTETNLRHSNKRAISGCLVILYCIAFLVVLSATNRIVFVGQDFPFISIQSKFALLLPITLMLLTCWSISDDKLKGVSRNHADNYEKLLLPAAMAVFTISCLLFIPQQGKNQNEEQFDVSALIHNLSDIVETIDKDFIVYQNQKSVRNTNAARTKDELWNDFINDERASSQWNRIKTSDAESMQFYKGLFSHFDSQQTNKSNPNELLHMRRRNGKWHLAVNKKYYFIPSALKNELQWKGDLYAAETKTSYNFKTSHNVNVRVFSVDDEFEANLLPANVASLVKNVKISRFDGSWTEKNEPLLLIASVNAKGSSQYFYIESERGNIKGNPHSHQMATKINDGDFIVIQKDEGEQFAWKYSSDSENYLAKNIWMNGRQRLFYPLGKESIWSYHFANHVSRVFGSDDNLRDSSLTLSIDYDLHKELYKHFSSGRKFSLSDASASILKEFRDLEWNQMKNDKNSTESLWYNKLQHKIEKKGNKNPISDKTLKTINRKIESYINKNVEKNDNTEYSAVVNAIDDMFEMKYDFAAVAIDGNGRIRLLFDLSKNRNIDPNNITNFNKFISEMYMNGSNKTERDILGNKALMLMQSGPASTFKPILYTAVTSRKKMDWNTLDVLETNIPEARDSKDKKGTSYLYYGGYDCSNNKLTINKFGSHEHDRYLIDSDNLYHSAIVLLGMQNYNCVESIFKPASYGKEYFPVMTYKGRNVSFNPDVWCPNNNFNVETGTILQAGLYNNFRMRSDLVSGKSIHSNMFGETEKFKILFTSNPVGLAWAYPETSSLNIHDINLNPIRGFNQLFLGASPLEISPIKMAENAMRLATLNNSEHITTLDNARTMTASYEPFICDPAWGSVENYWGFYKNQVLRQLRQIPLIGTARALAPFAKRLAQGEYGKNGKKYYMYAKTGTLNVASDDQKRVKPLLVLITDSELENIPFDNLKDVRYYAIYLSFMDIRTNDFNTKKFQPILEKIVQSELFTKYMEGY